jgi:hypothetical protein
MSLKPQNCIIFESDLHGAKGGQRREKSSLELSAGTEKEEGTERKTFFQGALLDNSRHHGYAQHCFREDRQRQDA